MSGNKIRHLNSCYIDFPDGQVIHNGLQLDIFIFKIRGNMLIPITYPKFIMSDIKPMPLKMIFPLKERFFENILVYIPNKYKKLIISAWGNYPPKIPKLKSRETT